MTEIDTRIRKQEMRFWLRFQKRNKILKKKPLYRYACPKNIFILFRYLSSSQDRVAGVDRAAAVGIAMAVPQN